MSKITIKLLDDIQDGFNRHDVPDILSRFTDDGVWLMASGPIAPDGRCLLYTSPSPRDRQKSRMPSSA